MRWRTIPRRGWLGVATEWLADQSVPLWAFVLALLTSPREWSRYAVQLGEEKLGITLGTAQDSDRSRGD